MSNENLQQSHYNQQHQLSPNDYIKLLDSLFQTELSPKRVDEAFKHFEANFKTQPILINLLIDYYFDHGFSSALKQKQDHLNDFSYSSNELYYTESSKTIVDLLFCIPDDLSNKVFDKLSDKLATVPTSSSSANLTPMTQNNFVKLIDKSLYLLVLIAYRKKPWITRLASHNIFNTLIKILKISTNLNEIITVQASLLFVSILNTTPLQIFNQHLDNIFNIFICLFKYLASLEQPKQISDGINIRNVKWSVRLYFYVCYGLFPNQFLQFLRKKDQHLANKEFLTSIFFYLRLHPALLKEKVDFEKQLKQINEDISLEWRQYCLDPLCTNFNNCIQKLLKSSPILCSSNVITPSTSKTPNNLTQLYITNDQQHSLNTNSIDLSAPLSPSDIFAATIKTSSLFELENSNKRNLNLSFQSSVPSTPTPGLNQNQAFVFPIENLMFDSNQQHTQSHLLITQQAKQNYQSQLSDMTGNVDKSWIKNLTSEFWTDENNKSSQTLNDFNKNVFNTYFKEKKMCNLNKKKSLSDTCLYFDYDEYISKISKSNPVNQNKMSSIIQENDHSGNVRLKQAKSELRDKNIKEPFSLLTFNRPEPSNQKRSSNQPNVSTMDSSTNTYDDDTCLSSQTSINMAKINSIESNDIISGYFSGLSHVSSDTNSNQNALISKLKKEINHLVLQLVYERYLRNKYEEDSNRLHFIKTERDQLIVEKRYLEKNLKELVEQYKKEVEDSLSIQNKSEIKAFKKELDDKNEFIENLQKKLSDCEQAVTDWSQKYDTILAENRKLENEYGKAMQFLEKEKNLKIKNEVDHNYTKSLRETTDLLRKKLLIMSKTQQNLVQTFNQELADLSNIYNSQIASFTSNKEVGSQFDHLVNITKALDTSNNYQSSSSLILTPVYQFQQKTIEIQENEIESLKLTIKKLLAKCNEHELELDSCKKNLTLKETKVEELVQTLHMEVVDMNAELLKTHHRIQSSLMNVNKRLEEEILKLKANLNEQTVKNQKSKEIIEANELELKELKQNLFNIKTESHNLNLPETNHDNITN